MTPFPDVEAMEFRMRVWILSCHTMLRYIIRIIAFLVCLQISAIAAADVPAVITHSSVTETTLSRQSLLAVFGMHTQRWPDGQRIKVFVLASNQPLHRKFATEVLGTYPYQLDRIWQRLVYSGTGRAPYICTSEEDMRMKVRNTPGAIGYVGRIMEEDTHVITIK